MNESGMLKNYWIWVAVVLVAGSFLLFFKFDMSVDKSAGSNIGTLIIYFEDGKRKFEGPVESEMTVLETMQFASMGGSFDFRYFLDEKNGVVVSSIGENLNMGSKSWYFYLNGKSIPVRDINKTEVKPGDAIEVKYE